MYYTHYRGQKLKMKSDIHLFCQKGITKSIPIANMQTRMVNIDKITCFKGCLSNTLNRLNLYFPSNGFFCSPYAPSHAFPVDFNAASAATDTSFQLQDQPLRELGKLEASFPLFKSKPVISLITFSYKRKIAVFVSHTNKTSCSCQGINPWCFTSCSCMSLFLFCMSESKILLLLFRLI